MNYKNSLIRTLAPLLAIILFTSCVPLVGGCKKSDSGSTKQPTGMVWMDEAWNVDYAKGRCEQRTQNHLPICIGDPKDAVRDYQLQVATAFAADTTCHGFTLTGTRGVTKTEDLTGANWQLMFDFDPGEDKQSWSLVDKKTSQVVGMGTEGPRETAHALCIVISKKGGSVE